MTSGTKILLVVVGAAGAAYVVSKLIAPKTPGTTTANRSSDSTFLGGFIGGLLNTVKGTTSTTPIPTSGFITGNALYPGGGTYNQVVDPSLVVDNGNTLTDLNTGNDLVYGTD